MLTELGGKAGCFCGPALKGELRCPLNVRSTSEDVLTGNLWGTLEAIDPRLWVADLLNRGLGTNRFRRKLLRKFRIDVWERQPRPTGLPWREGSTEVDVVLRWENPSTTVFVEMKLGSGVSRTTSHNDGRRFPADQIARNLRVGLAECGRLPHAPPGKRFPATKGNRFPTKRDFALLLLTPHGDEPAVSDYRSEAGVRSCLPPSLGEPDLPAFPLCGSLSFADVTAVLENNRRRMHPAEKALTDRLSKYLDFKAAAFPKRTPELARQVSPTTPNRLLTGSRG